MTTHRATLRATLPHWRGGVKIELVDNDCTYDITELCTGITIHASVDTATRVTLDLICEVFIEADGVIVDLERCAHGEVTDD